MLTDLKHAFYSLRNSPGFTVAAVLTLALGLGANTTIFSLVHGLFLRELPFARPAELVRVYCEDNARGLRQVGFSVPRFEHYRAGQTAFTDFAAENFTTFTYQGGSEPVQIGGVRVTANYFALLGVAPLRGRTFLAEEEASGNVTVVSEKFWRQRLNSDPQVVGSMLNLDGFAYSIVGVVPDLPVTWIGASTEIFANRPLEWAGGREQAQRGASFLRFTGRLRPGVDLPQAAAMLGPVHTAYRVQFAGNFDAGYTPSVVGVAEDATGNLRPAFAMLLGAVGLVLLIACSNVANLLLVRFSGRRREIAVRTALGAPRATIIRLFVCESVLVSLLAGAVGTLLAWRLLALVPYFTTGSLPINGLAIPFAAHVFTLGVCLITGVAMGFYPAWESSRTNLVDALRDGGRSGTSSPAQQKFQRSLLTSQSALSLLLLTAASLLIVSFIRLQRQPLGFQTDRIWTATLNLPPARYADSDARARFIEQLLGEIRAMPGVESAAAGRPLPLAGFESRTPYARADLSPPPINDRPLGLMRFVTSDYFRTLGIPLTAGRDFNERDHAGKPSVALISRSSAEKLFPGENPIGRRMFFSTNNGTGIDTEIVGVVGDVRSVSIAQANDIEFYRPLLQRSLPTIQIAVRTTAAASTATSLVRAALQKVDPTLPLTQPGTLADAVAASLGQQRLLMTMLGGFAGVALVLTLVGIYGIVAYSVAQRTTEVGIRLALGATPAQVVGLLLREGLRPVAWGLVIGLVAALAVGELFAAQLYQTSASDPLVLASLVGLLAGVAAVACLVPARRASTISPVTTLRG